MHEVKHTSLLAAKDARMEEGTGKKTVRTNTLQKITETKCKAFVYTGGTLVSDAEETQDMRRK
jgi:hypothetical protein